MNENKIRFRLGLFVFAGFALLVVMLYYFGASDLFTRKVRLYTVFPESVQGLSTGAAVKYRGAPVGAVSKISVLINERAVCVEMEVSLESFNAGGHDAEAAAFRELLIREIREGMRCRMEFAGITGLKFIDFDYFAKSSTDLPPEPAGINVSDALYVPSVPSTFQDISSTVGIALERLGRIPFEEIADGVTRSLDDISRILGDPALISAIHRINATAENIEASSTTFKQVFREDKLNDIVGLVRTNLDRLNVLMEQISAETSAMELARSAAAIRSAAGAFTEMRDDVDNTMFKFNQMLDAVRMLVDYLGTDPNSIVNGKKKPILFDWRR